MYANKCGRSYFVTPETTGCSCCGSLRQRILFRYAYLLTRYSVWFCLATLFLVSCCVTISFLLFDPPDFSDPIQGFEPRGTTISKRSVAWNNLMKATGADLELSTFPVNWHEASDDDPYSSYDASDVDFYQREQPANVSEGDPELLESLGSSEDSTGASRTEIQLCGNPDPSYARIVFQPARKDESLFTLESIISMCHLESEYFTSHIQFLRSCYTGNLTCCSSWNLGVYVALLSGQDSCESITAQNVDNVLNLIMKCSHYYRTKELKPHCASYRCQNVPDECVQHDAVFNILHYLVDVDFMSAENPNNDKVKFALTLLPVYAGRDIKEIYEDNFKDVTISDGVTTVSGLYFNIKEDLFSEYLTRDALYPCLGILAVVVLMWVYIGSFFVTMMGMINIAMSLFIAYFLYVAVLRVPFFPFMNLTSIILLVGIGADDTFVFCDIWKQVSRDRTNVAQVILLIETLRHAALSMFVTSFTTASAFFVNAISSITSIRCFGIFSGLAILSNFMLSITWLPAVITFQDTYLGGLDYYFESTLNESGRGRLRYACRIMRKKISEWSRIFFEKVLPFIVIKGRYGWLLFCGCIMLGGFCTIFVYPKLHLPTSPQFQLFQSSHPFERYDFYFKNEFWFEKTQSGSVYGSLPVIVVWGVKDVDNGNLFDPNERGSLVLKEDFDITHPASQVWLLQFCQNLRNQTFLKASKEWHIENCFIETLKYWMEFRDCADINMAPCCRNATFPYDPQLFQYCLEMAVYDLHQEYPMFFDKKKPGPRFSAADNSVSALIVAFSSTSSFSYVYEDMKLFVEKVQGWVTDQLKGAPASMEGGWFTSDLDFYDLQDHLASGTPLALGLSVIIATVVLFLTTQNLLISFFAILSISGALCATIGTLVLLGWQLNILESVILSVAVGLAIDFTVHYGVAYCVSPDKDQESRVVFALSRMGAAIAMAALTTFIAGAMMLPASILSYTQMGTFLMLIMTFSWLFSTFFFQSICRICGPQGTSKHLNQICVCCQNESVHMFQRYNRGVAPVAGYNFQDMCNVSSSYQSSSSSADSAQETEASPFATSYPSTEMGQCANDSLEYPSYSDTMNTYLSKTPANCGMYDTEVKYKGGQYVSNLVPSTQEFTREKESKPALLPNSDPNIPDIWLKR